MLVVGREPQSASTSSGLHQYLPAPAPAPAQVQHAPQQPQLDLALEGRSIPLQQRASSTTPAPQPASREPASDSARNTTTFSPSCLQLRIDLLSEQGTEDDEERPASQRSQKGGPLSRRQRAQLKRRQEQQKPAEEVVYQRRTRPKTPACPRLPLTMSTMSMPAAGQKFVSEDAGFGSAEEASAAVKRLLAKNEHHVTSHVTSHVKKESATFISDGYLQDSFDFLHQRHMKNLTDVISRHRQQQPQQEEEEQHSSQLASKFKKQVHIHQSSFYDANNESMSGDTQTFKSTKSINLANSNNNSSSDMEDKRRYVREDSASSLRSGSSDNCNNNYCDTINKSNSKVSSKSSTSSTTSSTSSSTTRLQQSFTSKKQIIKQSFSSSSQDFDDRIGIDVMLTPSQGAMVLAPAEVASVASVGTKKVKETSKVTSSVYSSSSDRPDEIKQSVKSSKSKTVKKMVSDGKQVHTDVDKFSETAVEEAEGAGDKPVITFSHVSSEGSHQAFTDIVRFDSSALSSPSRSRSPSPLLEMPAPYSDLSREIKRPPIQKA